ncbi:MAG: C4-type zinc ribbon domain-containing protein [bacterium]|nr:C4-type zinc ribbon domain-containing protein [bacterium]
MTETIRKLLELQRIDTELIELRQAIERIPRDLRKEQELYEQAVRALRKEEDTWRHVDEERIREEQSIASSAERIRQLKAKQGQVKKNQEYQALTHEIQMAEESNQKHRAALDRVRERRAAVEAAIAQQQGAVAARKEEFMRRAEEAKARVQTLQEELRQRRALRKELTKGINPEALGLYEKLLKTRAPMVLAAVDPQVKVCTGCNITLTEQALADLVLSDRLVTCETCARILYLKNTSSS